MITAFGGNDVVWQPLAKQALALSCPSRELLYGGEKGGGKSAFLVACWLPLLQIAHQKWTETGRKQYRCRIIIFRRNLEDLKDVISKSRDLYPLVDPEMGDDGYHINDKTWTFTSGATLAFRHLDGPTDHMGYNGHEYVGIGFDEVQFIPYEAYRFLSWQLRSSDPDYHRLRMIRATANPGGEEWVLHHFFIDQCPDGGKIYEVGATDAATGENATTRAFIRAKLTENTHLSPDYRAQMAANMTEDEVAMYLEGDFRRVAGSYFSKLLRTPVHFQKSRPIPGDWEMRFAMDWGSTNPASLHVGALDPDGRLYIIDELHKPGITGRSFGEHMKDMWKRQKWSAGKVWTVDEFYGVIDKQAMDRYGSEQTAAAGIVDWGFRLFEAKKDRLAGCNQLKERLLLDRFNQPQLIVFEDRCPSLCSAMSKIKSNAPEKPEEYDPRSDYAHAVDSLRFLCMEFPVRATLEVDPRDASVRQWESYLAKAHARQRRSDDDNRGIY